MRKEDCSPALRDREPLEVCSPKKKPCQRYGFYKFLMPEAFNSNSHGNARGRSIMLIFNPGVG